MIVSAHKSQVKLQPVERLAVMPIAILAAIQHRCAQGHLPQRTEPDPGLIRAGDKVRRGARLLSSPGCHVAGTGN